MPNTTCLVDRWGAIVGVRFAYPNLRRYSSVSSPESPASSLGVCESGLGYVNAPGAGAVLLDGCGARLAHDFILRTGAAGTADCADQLAALYKRNAAARGNDVIERGDIVQVVELDRVLEGLGLAT